MTSTTNSIKGRNPGLVTWAAVLSLALVATGVLGAVAVYHTQSEASDRTVFDAVEAGEFGPLLGLVIPQAVAGVIGAAMVVLAVRRRRHIAAAGRHLGSDVNYGRAVIIMLVGLVLAAVLFIFTVTALALAA